MTEQQHPPCNFAPLTCPCGKWADEAEAEIARLNDTLAIARGTLDALDKSHADLARRLADAGRENGRFKEALETIAIMRKIPFSRIIAKMREHAIDGQNGAPEYALDRLLQIQKLADTVLRATDI